MPYVDVGPHRLWVTERGTGAPIVFVHGLFLDGRMFDAQAQALSERYRTVQIDVRDHGRSDGPPEAWDLWDAADEIATALDALEIGPVHWVGLSMGGMIGLRFALEHPDKLRSLVLLDTSAGPEPRAVLHQTMAQSVRAFGRPMARLLMPYVVRQMFSPEGRDSEAAQAWTERILALEPEALARSAMAVFERDSVLDRIDGIQTPARVAVGEADQATPLPHAQAIVERLPDAELDVIPDAGHLTAIEAPDAVTDVIDGHLRHLAAHEAEVVAD